MTSDALRRSGLMAALLTLALVVGCEDSAERKAAREAQAEQDQAAKAIETVPQTLGSQSLKPADRDKLVTESLSKAQATLESLIAKQPNYWPAKAQLGSVLLQKGDFQGLRAFEAVADIRQNFSFAVQAAGFLKNQERVAGRKQSARQMFTDALATLGTQKADLQKQLADSQQQIADLDKKAKDLRDAAQAKDAKGQADKTAADTARAAAEQMKLSQEQLAALADAALRQVAAQDLISQAADLDAQAETLVNVKLRETVLKDVDATATSNPDNPGAPSKFVMALRKIPDEKARAELAVAATQGRIRAIEGAEADYKQAIAAADKVLSGEIVTLPDGSKVENLTKTIDAQLKRTGEELGRVAASAKYLQAAVAGADA
ncbi:MAG: hypothetical protein PHU85_08545, partial [Phycisphaerae bacterium]|nr:hypothetical protein [Phycisphaerae bacterium]